MNHSGRAISPTARPTGGQLPRRESGLFMRLLCGSIDPAHRRCLIVAAGEGAGSRRRGRWDILKSYAPLSAPQGRRSVVTLITAGGRWKWTIVLSIAIDDVSGPGVAFFRPQVHDSLQ